MKSIKLKSSVIAVSSLLCGLSFAATPTDSDLQYNSLSIGFESSSVSGYSQRENAFSIGGSMLLADHFILSGSVGDSTFSPPGVTKVTTSGGDVGLAYRHAVSKSTDVSFGIDFSSTDIAEAGYNGVTQNSHSFDFGLRSLLTPQIEVDAGIGFANYQNETTNSQVALNSGNATIYSTGLRFHLNNEFVIRGGYGYQSYNTSNGKTGNSNSYAVTLGYYFQ